jgi:hypothetical protein
VRTAGPARSAAILVALVGVAVLLPAPGSGAARAAYPWKARVAAARKFARHRVGTVSFAIVGEHGNLRGYKPQRRFHSASVVKAMLMVSYLRRPSVRNRALDDHDRALLRPMITRSDNSTATAVYDIVGNSGLDRLARAAHMRDFHPSVVWGLSEITARDQSLFFYRLRHYIPARHRRYAFHLLSHIVSYQRWGVPPARPRGWKVFFKGGFIPASDGWRINQVALLRRGSRKLALAVLSHGNPSLGYGAKTVQGVTARLLRGYDRLGGATTSAQALTSFHSPSGNIRCSILRSGVRCDIQRKDWQPPPKPSSCEFDWGGSIGLTRRGKAHFLCVSDAVEPGRKLDYGDSLTRHRFRCASLTSGVRCTNKRNGHGFVVSRQGYRFF